MENQAVLFFLAEQLLQDGQNVRCASALGSQGTQQKCQDDVWAVFTPMLVMADDQIEGGIIKKGHVY